MMTEPPDLKEGEPYKYDFAEAERILRTMDFLRGEAVDRRNEEIVKMIDALFRLLLTTHSCILRSEMAKLAGNEMVQ